MTALPPWPAPPASGPVRARLHVPGSKSLTNRALVLAALATGPSQVAAPLRSRDTLLMAAALRTLGAGIEDTAQAGWSVRPLAAGSPGAGTVECGNAGTVARFLPAVAALGPAPRRFVGDPRMGERPVGPLLAALRSLGVAVDGDAVPFTVHGAGGVAGGQVRLDAGASSQFVSGLLLSAARFAAGLSLEHSGSPLPSRIQLEMTVEMLREHGVAVTAELAADRAAWRVEAGPIAPLNRRIEPDLSSAAPFLAAAAATGGAITVADWPVRSSQPGRLWPGLLEQMGARWECGPAGLTVTGPDRLRGLDVDLRDYGEAVPTLAALAVLAATPTRLRGVGHLRFQETDRLAALAQELGRLGARVQVCPDGLRIDPVPLSVPPGTVLDPRADHRLAMAFAVVGLVVPGVLVADIATAGKTVPDFAGRWQRMLGFSAGCPA